MIRDFFRAAVILFALMALYAEVHEHDEQLTFSTTRQIHE